MWKKLTYFQFENSPMFLEQEIQIISFQGTIVNRTCPSKITPSVSFIDNIGFQNIFTLQYTMQRMYTFLLTQLNPKLLPINLFGPCQIIVYLDHLRPHIFSTLGDYTFPGQVRLRYIVTRGC